MWSRATIHATRNLRTGRNARPALSRFYLDVSKRSKRKNAANPIGRGGSIDATFGSSSFPFFITAPTDLSRVYLTTIARTDDYNSTINFASRKILFLSFFDRLKSTCLFFSFFPPSPFSPSSTLSLSSEWKIYSPSSHRLLVASVFPLVRRKEKKFLRSIAVPLYRFFFIVLCFFYYFQPFKKKRKEKKRIEDPPSRCGQCFVRISLLLYSSRNYLNYQLLEWLLEMYVA